MKRSILILAVAGVIALMACEEEITVPDTFVASEGTYIGVVHLAYGSVSADDQVNYIVERLNENTAEWLEISWTDRTDWADEGYLLNNGIIPGKEYRYRMRTHSDGTSFSDYSEEFKGHAWKAMPAEITEVNRTTDSGTNEITLKWANYNDISMLENLTSVAYEIYRAERDYPENLRYVQRIEQYIEQPNSIPTNYAYVDNSQIESSETYIYKVRTHYGYNYTNCNGDYREQTYEVESMFTEESTSGGATANYAAMDLGDVLSSTTGSITRLEEKYLDNTLYVGALKDVGSAGYGKPALFQYTGSSWQEVWTSLPDVRFDKIHFAVGTSSSYMAGISDSLCVYQWDGAAWSENLTPDNLGQDESPSSVSIATLNDELYMAIKQAPDYELMVMKYTGSNWETIGGDASGIIDANAFAPKLQNLEGTLYLTYTHNDNDIYIKHLNGNTWNTDLQWAHENNGNIKIAKNATDMYLLIGETGSNYQGGIYQVTSSSAAEELIANTTHEWFHTPQDLTIDSEGNLVVASIIYESASLIYPALSIYNGSEWMRISGDFSNGVVPVCVKSIGADLYYLYGDAASINQMHDPTTIKATKFTK